MEAIVAYLRFIYSPSVMLTLSKHRFRIGPTSGYCDLISAELVLPNRITNAGDHDPWLEYLPHAVKLTRCHAEFWKYNGVNPAAYNFRFLQQRLDALEI
jgi:hypothetical protein